MANLVIACATNIEALPNELLAPILRMTGQSTCARVSRHWQDVQTINFSSLRDEYSRNPKIRKFMPTTDRPETSIECGEILRQTVANVRGYYRKFSGVQPDGFSRTNLIEACHLAELISEADDKNLVTLWNHLPPEIFQQLAILTPYPANATNAQIASAIRNGIQTNREAILAVLSQVTELSLFDTGLSALPPEIGLFVNLQTLSLRSNQLSTLPTEIGHLVNLQTLDLEFNKLKTLPREIGNLMNLQTLDLEFNKLKTLPPEIGHLVNLQRFDLTYNQITSLPAEIGHLVNLQVLLLSFNKLTSLPAEIGHLMNLQILNLIRNNLSYTARTLIANYRIQNPACLIHIDPRFFSTADSRDNCISRTLVITSFVIFFACLYL